MLNSTCKNQYLKSSQESVNKKLTLNAIHLKAQKNLNPLKEDGKRKNQVKTTLSKYKTHKNHDTYYSSMDYKDGLLFSSIYEPSETESNLSVTGNF